MQRRIIDFFQDAAGDWTARLDCGHPQHVRHNPPLSERPWVLSKAGRQAMLGASLDCRRCAALELPEGMEAYKATPVFTETTLPEGLRRRHATKAGIWGLIQVEAGQLHYAIEPPLAQEMLLEAGRPGIIPPEVYHWVRPEGAVRFSVTFYKRR